MKNNLTPQKLAKMIDQTLLKAYVSDEDFQAFCKESAAYDFKMVAINSAPVKKCREFLKDSDVHVGAAISFLWARQPSKRKYLRQRQQSGKARMRSTM